MKRSVCFASLHNHTHYSVQDSLIKVDDLYKAAESKGISSIAMTDHGNCHGHYEFSKLSSKYNVKPIYGAEIYLEEERKGEPYHLILLAKSNDGLSNIYRIMSESAKNFYRTPRATIDMLEAYHDDIVCLSACVKGYTAFPLIKGEFDKAKQRILTLRDIFGDDFYLEVQDGNTKFFDVSKMSYEKINKIKEMSRDDRRKVGCELPDQLTVTKFYRDIGKELGIRIVATNDAHYVNKEDSFVHDVLLCLRTHTKITDPIRDENNKKGRFAFDSDNLYIKSGSEIAERFRREEVEVSGEIARACNVSLTKERVMPRYNFVPDGMSKIDYFRSLLNKGWKHRKINSKGKSAEYKARLFKEVSTLEKADLVDYFLILHDIMEFCDRNNIFHGPGRGSACGCLVSYLLGITNVDPLRHDLIFERFYNEARADGESNVDIDSDFEDTKRSKVLKYISERYGNEYVCQIVTFGTLDAKAAVKGAGRALGMDYGLINYITKYAFPKHYDGLDDAISKSDKLKNYVKKYERLFHVAKKIEGTISHKGVHACGVLLNSKSFSTGNIPLAWDAKTHQVISGFDGKVLDKLGYTKIDILGLKTLSIIKETIELVNKKNSK